jgi:hypothetical protein
MRAVMLLLLISILNGCAQRSQEQISSEIFEAGASTGVLEGTQMREASGLVASINNPGMLWTHNDSGNAAEIFLIDGTGKLKCTIHFPGLKNRDWEEIAIGAGPDPAKSYLYIGEIGDNNAVYEYKFIYRIEEPVITGSIKDSSLTNVDKIEFRLSDGARDTEAMTIDPVTKDIFIFSKRERKVNLYKLSGTVSTTVVMTAERVLEGLPFTWIVAADISEDGSEILVKNYDNVFYWKRLSGESVDEAIKRTHETLPYSPEPQGESIAFSVKEMGITPPASKRIKCRSIFISTNASSLSNSYPST